MKKILLFSALFAFVTGVFAQAPAQFSYQTVIRNSSGALVANQAVGLKFSILQGSSIGTAVYVETQTATTNINGLASVAIGAGIPVAGILDTIAWANGPYFLETQTDPTGGTTYTITGTSQLLSVPFALSAGSTSPIGFYAENDSAVTISGATAVPFSQVRYNNGGGYNPVTSTFTAPVSGNYHMDMTVQFPGGASQYPVFMDIYVNGNFAKRFVRMIPALLNYGFGFNQTYDLNLAAGTTLQLYVSQLSGSNLNLPDNGGSNDSFWSVNKY